MQQCIGGYSTSTDFRDRIEKARYRLSQYWQSYPDWKHSSAVLLAKIVEKLNAPGTPLHKAQAEFEPRVNYIHKNYNDIKNLSEDKQESLFNSLNEAYKKLMQAINSSPRVTGDEKLMELINANNEAICVRIQLRSNLALPEQ